MLARFTDTRIAIEFINETGLTIDSTMVSIKICSFGSEVMTDIKFQMYFAIACDCDGTSERAAKVPG